MSTWTPEQGERKTHELDEYLSTTLALARLKAEVPALAPPEPEPPMRAQASGHRNLEGTFEARAFLEPLDLAGTRKGPGPAIEAAPLEARGAGEFLGPMSTAEDASERAAALARLVTARTFLGRLFDAKGDPPMPGPEAYPPPPAIERLSTHALSAAAAGPASAAEDALFAARRAEVDAFIEREAVAERQRARIEEAARIEAWYAPAEAGP